ncbi:hypothetical protein LPKJCM_01900 [Lentilactobacillus parakefiri]|uniref:Uncharacterized protein n=2 Tax=Lentilactobacillus parakefiri TaxID=152332 RepID=A0A224VKP2_9LACO|nr:hypothetical protein LPKJCM_01900 [Lentilactobacillus parakefiri]
MAANMNKLAKMMANLTHIFGWIEKLSRIFQRKWKMGSTIYVVGNRFLSITDDSFFIYH